MLYVGMDFELLGFYSNHFWSSAGHSSDWSARSAQFSFPVHDSIWIAYTDVARSSLSVISRYSLPAVMVGKYLPIRPYSRRRASLGSVMIRAVPKTTTLRNWRENSSATFDGSSLPNSLASRLTFGLLSILERI